MLGQCGTHNRHRSRKHGTRQSRSDEPLDRLVGDSLNQSHSATMNLFFNALPAGDATVGACGPAGFTVWCERDGMEPL